jgi:hypothetical protein
VNKIGEKIMREGNFISVKIFGWGEFIIGVLGTILFAFFICATLVMYYNHIVHSQNAWALIAIIPITWFLAPSILLLLGGLGVIKHSSWASKINRIAFPLFCLSLFAILLAGRYFEEKQAIATNHSHNLLVDFLFNGAALLSIPYPFIIWLIMATTIYYLDCRITSNLDKNT